MENITYIVGSKGYLGSRLLQHLGQNRRAVGMDRLGAGIRVDLCDRNSVNNIELKANSDMVFTAAVSSPDACLTQFNHAWRINVEGTSQLIDKALSIGCRVIFFSSDAVFASEPDVVFDEKTELKPKYPYGKTKAEIERRFWDSGRLALDLTCRL